VLGPEGGLKKQLGKRAEEKGSHKYPGAPVEEISYERGGEQTRDVDTLTNLTHFGSGELGVVERAPLGAKNRPRKVSSKMGRGKGQILSLTRDGGRTEEDRS